MKSLILTLMISLYFSSCATTHPGHLAKATQNTNLPLIISAEIVDGSKSDAYQLIDVTFENSSDRWVKINSTKILLTNPSSFSIVTGTDLRDWGQAMSFKLKKDKQNKDIAQSALMIGGGVIATGSSSQDLKVAGSALLLTGFAWATADIINSSLKNSTQADTVPDNHLSHPFSVPGKLFTRRWVLINKPSGANIDKLTMEVETISGEKEVYEVIL